MKTTTWIIIGAAVVVVLYLFLKQSPAFGSTAVATANNPGPGGTTGVATTGNTGQAPNASVDNNGLLVDHQIFYGPFLPGNPQVSPLSSFTGIGNPLEGMTS